MRGFEFVCAGCVVALGSPMSAQAASDAIEESVREGNSSSFAALSASAKVRSDLQRTSSPSRTTKILALSERAGFYPIEAVSQTRGLLQARATGELRLRFNEESSLALSAHSRRLRVGWQTRF